MTTAPSMRSGGARMYSQSGDIDQLLEDAWVPDSRGERSGAQPSGPYRHHQAEPQTTEKERALMAQLADAQRQLRELGRNWGYDSGSNSRSSDWDGHESDGQRRAWHSRDGPNRYGNKYSNPHDSWDDSRESSDSRSPNAYSGHESPEPLYVNTDIVAVAARAPTPPPRTRFTPPATAAVMTAGGPSAGTTPHSTVVYKTGPAGGQNLHQHTSNHPHTSHHQHISHHQHNEKASSSQREASVEVKESVSIFQVYPPTSNPTPSSRTKQPLQQQSQHPAFIQPTPQPSTLTAPRSGKKQPNLPANEGLVSPGAAFRFPLSNQPTTVSHHSSSSSKRTENFHSHDMHPPENAHSHSKAHATAVHAHPHSEGTTQIVGNECSESSVTNKTPNHQFHQHQSHRSETAHMSNNYQSVINQKREASSNSKSQSQGVSDVYSETTSLQPIGAGIQTLQSHTALHKLRQTNSGFQIGSSRIKTLNLSTPQLDQTLPAASFRPDQQLAVPVQHSGVGALRGSSTHVSATPNGPVQLLPMAFMVAMPSMPTATVSLQQLNMFSGTSGLALSAYPTLTGGSQHSNSVHQHSLSIPHHGQQHQSHSQVRSSRSMTRSQQQILNDNHSAHSSARSSSSSGFHKRITNSASLQMPRVVVEAASSSGGSSTTIHAADFETDDKPYVELRDLRPAHMSGSATFGSAARRSQSTSGVTRVELHRSTGGGGGANRRLRSNDTDESVFNNATYASATLQASVMEPRTSFLRASSSSHHQQQRQQQQPQQQLRTDTHSPGSVTPTRRLSGHSGGSFEYDPPSPSGLLRFENDTSQLWYMPNISREEAISFLHSLPSGRFVVRNSTSFPGAYGLAVKVAEVPPGAAAGEGGPGDELVRHFLIEQTSKGVRIRGCANEPIFASLAALIYQHTVTPLALPCKLMLPGVIDVTDSTTDVITGAGAVDPRIILEHGAACNVLYLGATDIESLTGSAGLSRAVDTLLKNRDRLRSCVCQLKVARDGISLTDTVRRQFFRKHYPTACVLYCSMDPGQRCFDSDETRTKGLAQSRIFGFVARKIPGSQENTAIVMCEVELHQPAEAVVRFVDKYLIGGR